MSLSTGGQSTGRYAYLLISLYLFVFVFILTCICMLNNIHICIYATTRIRTACSGHNCEDYGASNAVGWKTNTTPRYLHLQQIRHRCPLCVVIQGCNLNHLSYWVKPFPIRHAVLDVVARVVVIGERQVRLVMVVELLPITWILFTSLEKISAVCPGCMIPMILGTLAGNVAVAAWVFCCCGLLSYQPSPICLGSFHPAPSLPLYAGFAKTMV